MPSHEIADLTVNHISSEDLALLALSEPATPGQAEHLHNCPSCAAELAELAQVVAVGRDANPDELLVHPPEGVWEAILTELGASGIGQAEETAQDPDPVGPANPAAPHAADPALPTLVSVAAVGSDGIGNEPAVAGRPGSEGAEVVTMPRRGRNRWLGLAAAAAVGAVLGGSVVAVAANFATSSDDVAVAASGSPTASERVMAQAVLNPIPGRTNQTGTAVASQGPDGLEIRVDARGLPAGKGFYEVWLLDEQATKLVALGALPAGSVGTFTVPPGVSITDFPVVDISLEPYDGDPGHSHDSLLRGQLQA